jgi:hypothetical protein
MARVHIEETLLREPNLWVPGKKPVGNVKIDWSHPLARDLVCVLLLDKKRQHDYVTNTVTGAWSASVPPYIDTKFHYEKITFFSATDPTATGDILYPYSVSGAPSNTDDFSVACSSTLRKAISGTTYPHMIGAREGSSLRFTLLANGEISSGAAVFSVYTSGGNSAAQSDFAIDDLIRRSFVGTYSDSGDKTSRLYVDQEVFTGSATTGTINAWPVSSGGLAIGNRIDNFIWRISDWKQNR